MRGIRQLICTNSATDIGNTFHNMAYDDTTSEMRDQDLLSPPSQFLR